MVAGLVGQDYESLQYLFFLVGPDDEVRQAYESHIAQHLPLAAVRKVEGNPGYGPTQNAAARLVEGDNGLFLFLHDDVCLASNAVSELVTELSRSNAAVVGPKLVQWDDPSLLQHVGMGVDRCGEIDPHCASRRKRSTTTRRSSRRVLFAQRLLARAVRLVSYLG